MNFSLYAGQFCLVALGLAIETGEGANLKQMLQAFYTPTDLAKRMVALANLKPGQRVLEPSCGAGNILHEIIQAAADLQVVGVEIDPVAAKAVKSQVLPADFLGLSPDQLGPFDAIVMNPPFTKGQDRAHVLHAWKFLKPGGRLVALTSPGWRFQLHRPAGFFRQFVEAFSVLVEDVPAGTFRESGTDVATVLIVLEKPPA